MFNGEVLTYFDASTHKKSLVIATTLDVDGEAYLAIHTSKGRPFLHNAKFGKAGSWNKGAVEQADERSHVYLDRGNLLDLYQHIARLLGMPNEPPNGLPEHLPQSSVDMETQRRAVTTDLDDFLGEFS